MTESVGKCPFNKGCPFKSCKTKDEIKSIMTQLKNDDKWKIIIENMQKCPAITLD